MTENQPPLLRTENLSRSVKDRVLVADISITLNQGDILAVVGPSGAGKSSFLRLINRLDEPDSGTVYLEGRDYQNIPPSELRRRIGMVMQSPFLFPGTVAYNLCFGPRQRGETLSESDIKHLLASVGLSDFAQEDVSYLSGGEAQRVSLARTLANSPSVLLLDEPTSALDSAAEREVEKLILDIIRERRLGCLIVTHDLAQAKRLANRVMVMAQGGLKKIGTAKEVLGAGSVL